MSNSENLNENAKLHWEYTKGVIECVPVEKKGDIFEYTKWFPLLEYLYIQAFKHGYKHGECGDYTI